MKAVTFKTDGRGYWSRAVKAVQIVDMRLGYISDDRRFGELCVYFNTKDWDVNKDGLIYTDKSFITDLRNFLALHGLDNLDVEYSEQGMQGDNYVSLDVGAEFLQAWDAKFNAFKAMTA
jgi:hypothetical protein